MTDVDRETTIGQPATRHRSTGGAIRRALGLLAFLPVATRAPTYARLVWALALDERTPSPRKALLGAALGYVFLGRDLIPDDIPIVGGLDDLVVVALAVELFLDGVPPQLLTEKLDELAIDRRAFDEDIARIRRLTPRPVRRLIRRIPGWIGAAADTLRQTGLGPRLRAWIVSPQSQRGRRQGPIVEESNS
jgi:uncharacterized membrane protein YkvA (DUF1232 family)